MRIRDVSSTGIGLRIPGLSHGRPITADVSWTAGSGRGAPLKIRGTLLPRSTPGSFGFRFHRLLEEEEALRAARPEKLLGAGAMAVLAVVIGALKTRNFVSFWYDPLWQCYSLLAAAYLLSRVAFSLAYEEPQDKGIIKSLSVILPIKNEEANIEKVVRRLFEARYPADRVEVIAVDDGSTDKTWAVLKRIAPEFPRLQVHRFGRNKGKRHAMAFGALRAGGEILIFMDSDSMIEREGFYRIVQPFYDPRVGAVAGHTDVIVDPSSSISKMEAVRYFVSQRVMKAAESVFGAVNCCPGPFSAYRRDAVLKLIPEWLNQTFLGTAATFGDDRSLTNRILRTHRVIYHAGARCATYAPETCSAFLKQQLRWKKSWVRETLSTVRHMWREHPMAALPYYAGILVTLSSPAVVMRVFLYSPWRFGSATYLPYVAGLMLVYLLLGTVNYYHTQSRYWAYGLLFAVLGSWLLSLQTYYAILTVRRNHWGTR